MCGAAIRQSAMSRSWQNSNHSSMPLRKTIGGAAAENSSAGARSPTSYLGHFPRSARWQIYSTGQSIMRNTAGVAGVRFEPTMMRERSLVLSGLPPRQRALRGEVASGFSGESVPSPTSLMEIRSAPQAHRCSKFHSTSVQLLASCVPRGPWSAPRLAPRRQASRTGGCHRYVCPWRAKAVLVQLRQADHS
jgi:hypothetical protein